MNNDLVPGYFTCGYDRNMLLLGLYRRGQRGVLLFLVCRGDGSMELFLDEDSYSAEVRLKHQRPGVGRSPHA